MFPSEVLSEACWITTRAQNQTMGKLSKIMLLLKSHFDHWLSAEFGDNVLKLCKSMTDRSTALSYGDLGMSFHSNSSVAARNYIETYSCFNQLVFCTLDNILPRKLNTCELIRNRLDFHVDSEG